MGHRFHARLSHLGILKVAHDTGDFKARSFMEDHLYEIFMIRLKVFKAHSTTLYIAR